VSIITLAPPELTFDAATHSYAYRGAPVPGVTSTIGSLHSFAGVPREILAAACLRGTAAHLAAQFDDENDLDESALNADTAGRLAGWRKFKVDFQPVWIGIECMLYSRAHRVAGQSDRFARMHRRGFEGLWCIDIKTAAQSHPVWGVQTGGYTLMAAPAEPCRRGTVRLAADGTYQFDEWSDPADAAVFLSCLTLRNFSRKHNLK
jgi:hypothetical protein